MIGVFIAFSLRFYDYTGGEFVLNILLFCRFDVRSRRQPCIPPHFYLPLHYRCGCPRTCTTITPPYHRCSPPLFALSRMTENAPPHARVYLLRIRSCLPSGFLNACDSLLPDVLMYPPGLEFVLYTCSVPGALIVLEFVIPLFRCVTFAIHTTA